MIYVARLLLNGKEKMSALDHIINIAKTVRIVGGVNVALWSVGQNQVVLRHLIIHFPTSSGVS